MKTSSCSHPQGNHCILFCLATWIFIFVTKYYPHTATSWTLGFRARSWLPTALRWGIRFLSSTPLEKGSLHVLLSSTIVGLDQKWAFAFVLTREMLFTTHHIGWSILPSCSNFSLTIFACLLLFLILGEFYIFVSGVHFIIIIVYNNLVF